MSFSDWWDRNLQDSVWTPQPENKVKEPDLVGKEEVTNCLIFRILHDGCDDLQHGSDSCVDGSSHVCLIKLEKPLLQFKIKDFVEWF